MPIEDQPDCFGGLDVMGVARELVQLGQHLVHPGGVLPGVAPPVSLTVERGGQLVGVGGDPGKDLPPCGVVHGFHPARLGEQSPDP